MMKRVLFLIVCNSMFFSMYCQDIHLLIKDTTDSNSITKRTIKISEFEIKAKLSDANIKSGSNGLVLDVNEMKMLPRLVGESDPYKALQYMGGVSQAGEANAGLYVRGGNNDQNLILLNGSLIQNPTHVMGLFSVFNPDLIEQMKFIKSGIPAEYGGRLSSVVDINTIGNVVDSLQIDGSVGLISSRISIKQPLNEKFSVFGSWRGSYISSIVLPSLSFFGLNETLTKNKYEFWDLNAGFVLQATKRTKISGHFYTGNDEIQIVALKEYNLRDNSSFWKNTAGGIQVFHLINDKTSLNQQFNFSGFNIQSKLNWYNSNQQLNSSFKILNYKADFLHVFNSNKLKYGVELNYNMAYPYFLKSDSIVPVEIENQHNNIFSLHSAFYIRNEWSMQRWLFNIGLRANIYTQIGPYTNYSESNVLDVYKKTDIVKSYSGFEPRFFTRYLIDDKSSFKLAASRHIQYLNQIPIINFGIPIDLQIPANLYVKPQNSWHFSTGYFRNFNNNHWEFAIETYFKTLENQLEFKNDLLDVFSNAMLERELMLGKGLTYGFETKIRKNYGKLTGWLTYNLAWNYRQFDGINNGIFYLARNDRRHDLSLIALYHLTDSWSFSSVFVYATGSRLNLPLSWYYLENKVVFEYGKYNSFEMPAYHRLDISANYKLKPYKNIKSELNFSVYNVYNRYNPYQVFYSTKNSSNDFDFKLKMSYLLPIIPSISWVFHY